MVAVPLSVLPVGCGFSLAAANDTKISFTTCASGALSFFLQEANNAVAAIIDANR